MGEGDDGGAGGAGEAGEPLAAAVGGGRVLALDFGILSFFFFFFLTREVEVEGEFFFFLSIDRLDGTGFFFNSLPLSI